MASRVKQKSILLYVTAWAIVIFSLVPPLWELLTSLKPSTEITKIPFTFFPSEITFEHYWNLFARQPFALYMWNSSVVASCATALNLCTGVPSAFALINLSRREQDASVLFLVGVTLFPYVFVFLGLLEVVRALGLGNSHFLLVILYAAINLPLTILVMRQFLLQIPAEIDDAARIDGYSVIQRLVKICLPLTMPAVVSTGILVFITSWNEFVFSLTFISNDALKTLPVAASQLEGAASMDLFEVPYGVLAAATIVGTIPLVLLVFAFQRKIIQGLTAGALKG